ncbi:MAG: hypothetical protein BWX55_00788 [Deltaproteobacteria bacterium ADurb.Bin022]|nr:MAG: hypothetical protein BWX55_00788 [Deltaproteobacteria bacterium ADurb.Bin022]
MRYDNDAPVFRFPDDFTFSAGQIAQNPLDNILHIADPAADVIVFNAFEHLFIMIQGHAQRPFGIDAHLANIFDGAVDKDFVFQNQDVNVDDINRFRNIGFLKIFLNLQQLLLGFLQGVFKTAYLFRD